jgi:hypothetical protein
VHSRYEVRVFPCDDSAVSSGDIVESNAAIVRSK